jgi:subtilisin family serine protease
MRLAHAFGFSGNPSFETRALEATVLKKLVLSLALAVLFAGGLAISSPPAVIAVLDSPVDYGHPEIQAVFDEGLLKNAKFVDDSGQEKSWYELNLEAKAEFEKRLNQKFYAEQVQFIDAMHAMLAANPPSDKALSTLTAMAKGTLKYIFSPKYRSSLNVVTGYLHGTHVAGITMKSLTNARLISFPIISAPKKKLTLSEILKFDPVKSREQIRRQLGQISEVLQKSNARVVNLSIASSNEIAFKVTKQQATFLQRTVFRGKLRKVANESAHVFTEELGNFFRANPNIVFVLAAGNEKRNLSKGSDHSANLRAENLLKVAAIDASGKIAYFSNRSSSYVDIAAIGTGVASALVGGGEMHMSGTSQAAPKVTNALARIFELAPHLSAKEAVETLYNQHTTSDRSLSGLIANGRVLKSEGATSETNPQMDAPKIQAEIGNMSERDLSKLIAQYAQRMVSLNVSILDIVISRNGVEGATIRLTNQEGQINVAINEIRTTTDHKPSIAAGPQLANSAAVACKDIFLGP